MTDAKMSHMKPTIITPAEQVTIGNLSNLNLAGIASVIRRNWKKVYFGAVPYLQAMATLNDVNEMYGTDSGRSIVIYFLSNAQTWKGPSAEACKAELNRRLKA